MSYLDYIHMTDQEILNMIRDLNSAMAYKWVTSYKPVVDKRRKKFDANGEKNAKAKLTVHSVRDIIKLGLEGKKVIDIAKVYNVSAPTISSILKGRSWNRVKRQPIIDEFNKIRGNDGRKVR